MEGNLQYSPKLGHPVGSDDVKYVSGLSTILVATIQEAKDRISQIEYIFCSQLYPNFQSKYKNLQKICSEAKKDAEDAWKEKENDFLLQIEKLQLEKQEALDENQSLKSEKAKSLREVDEKASSLVTKITSQQIRIDELEREVMQKSEEVDKGMELQNKLIQLVQTKATIIVDKGKQLKEHEIKTNGLLAKVKSLEKKVEELQEELREKTEEVAKKKNLNERIEFLMSELVDNGKLLAEHGEEKKKLMYKLECLEENVCGLQKELRKKTEEIEEGRVLQTQLIQQIDMNAVKILNQKQQLEESEDDKKLLLDKVNGLEKKLSELQENISSTGKVAEGKNSSEDLLQQIELKEYELLAEKKKKRDVADAYRRLRHQYNFLCTKVGLTTENAVPHSKSEDEADSLKHQLNPTSPDLDNKNLDASAAVCEMDKVKTEKEYTDGLEDDKVVKSIPNPFLQSPTSSYIMPKGPPTEKSAPVLGTKRPASCWIDTRSHQRKDGPDPHDDFLDTPLENLRGNLNKAMKEEDHDPNVLVQKDMNPDSSDDETQDLNVDPSPGEQQIPVSMTGKRSYKYVEPVRKKADRENLKGVECKQCKKFYDAVLPSNGGKYADGNKQNFRCEHHEGVSRHRYKYAPPMTPEGFWNIGFESEM